ncbi:MAG: amidohydrolase family protein [Mucilaginibacter polytrichastri]|nr:amidohydrolase family protein [Mucilaginibacter polytrichastri]
MKHTVHALLFSLLFFTACSREKKDEATLFQNVTLIDGTGMPEKGGVDVLVRADTIADIRRHADSVDVEATCMDMTGKFMMPLMINGHCHVGMLKGNSTNEAHFTPKNIRRHLLKYLHYGIGEVVSLGTDRPAVLPLLDSSRKGILPGAKLYSALYGIGIQGSGPAQQLVKNAEEARTAVQKLVRLKPDFVKIWVDDFGGSSPKMSPEIYSAVIDEAHKHKLRVAAHVYYLADARSLVEKGIDVLAHSIRDTDVDADMLAKMKAKNVAYMPTLSLDEYNFIYLRQPEWMNDPFFLTSLEPGVLDSLKSPGYLNAIKNDPKLEQKIAAFKTAQRNLKKIYDAGILVVMGTDSGAFPVRAQGFSEHLELELMRDAGLTPAQVISIATQNGARHLKIMGETGTLQEGKRADFMILAKDPMWDVKNTRTIESVWQHGKKVSGAVTENE